METKDIILELRRKSGLSQEELAQAPSMNEQVAQKVYQFFHSKNQEE